MTLIANNVTIPTDNDYVIANTTKCTKVVANNVTVWEKVVFTFKEYNFTGSNPSGINAYSGSVVELEIPITGTYQLEVYGAQAGNTNDSTGGLGGYAVGTKYLTAGQKLYICVGGQGAQLVTNDGEGWCAGGYNGGGSGAGDRSGGGGGATHIALGNNRGELRNYASFQSEILIVAGGGGGCAESENGFPGGGEEGGHPGRGGKQNQGGNGDYDEDDDGESASTDSGGFGYGSGADVGVNYWNYSAGGGGGGWYGGAGGASMDGGVAGGGGSGYIGGVDNGSMTSGIRSGNGYAKITLISS